MTGTSARSSERGHTANAPCGRAVEYTCTIPAMTTAVQPLNDRAAQRDRRSLPRGPGERRIGPIVGSVSHSHRRSGLPPGIRRQFEALGRCPAVTCRFPGFARTADSQTYGVHAGHGYGRMIFDARFAVRPHQTTGRAASIPRFGFGWNTVLSESPLDSSSSSRRSSGG